MRVYRSFDAIPYFKMTNVTIGTFDGIHQGHQRIIEALIQESRQSGCRSLVVTFDPHPQTVVRSKEPIGILTTLEEKIPLFEKLDVDNFLAVPFTPDFAEMEPGVFIRRMAVKVGLHGFYVGFNHAFGKNRKGNDDLLRLLGKELDFSVTVIPKVMVNGTRVSSTRLRHLILEGCVSEAEKFLGRPYSLEGLIQKGRGIGRTIGFPTANISGFSKDKLLPKDGVYAASAIRGTESFWGMVNIGFNPTVDGSNRQVEVHLFQNVGSLYGERMSVRFIERIRDEKQFDSVHLLGTQLQEDRKKAKSIIEKYIRR